MTEASVESPPKALSRRQINIAFIAIMLGMLLAALDQTIVSTALPTIVTDLGGAGHMAWVVTSYMLAEAVSTVLSGKLGDLFGRKRVFQASAVIFLAGSVVAGASTSMVMLIAARAFQGIGGGGLMVTAMALIADVIPLRERGKYQGALGAVFGVTTVLGPTLGGLFTDHASWRWCFYVNVPVGIIMIGVVASAIPQVRAAARPVIDYAGIALVALASCALVLALEWGGSEYAWGSAMIIGLFVGSVVLYVAFVLVELRVEEPMLPMSLFRQPVFTVCSILSFIVGFAMMGAMTYLPTYVQYVNGSSATMSGVRTLPMVVGLLITSMISGNVISTTGRYKVFPVAGMLVMALGLFLMSTMDRHTSVFLMSVYIFLLGLGLGLAMQVLTIAVQNTVSYNQLGTATSGVTFFRTIGGSFGTAIFGTLYTSQLDDKLPNALADSGVPAQVANSASALWKLPATQIAPVLDAYSDSITFVFQWVVPVAVIGFIAACFLKEVPLRDTARAGASDMGEGFGAPDSSDRVAQLERALAAPMSKLKDDPALRQKLHAASGSGIEGGQAWALGQIHWYGRIQGEASPAAIAETHRLPPEVLEALFADVVEAGYAERDGDALRLTAAGTTELDRLHDSWRRWLDTQLQDWNLSDPEDQALLDQAVNNIATRLVNESEPPPREPVSA
ncbi:MDR family MFS transporter [Streptomyces justiciae]|uniref:MDR family MFS transporter n=1 Tax=Streptomyces justiciae TaxID=2780140 RepID=UPI002118775B|nr:MDR family MFS transporter [Streptomyces justiciae]MCW8379769.1 MFS transporter [Streptomyces justiciae]